MHGKGATFAGNMRANVQSRGWAVLAVPSVAQLLPGDVLLADGHHTAMYVGNGDLAQDSIDEHGNAAGGSFGDATGRETLVRLLRFPGTAVPHPSPKDDVMSPIPLTVAADGTFRAAVMVEAGLSSMVVDTAWITWGSTFGASEFTVTCLDDAGHVMPNGARGGSLASNRRTFLLVPSGVVTATIEGRVVDHGAVPAASVVTNPLARHTPGTHLTHAAACGTYAPGV